MPTYDARTMIATLADPVTLLVFGAIVTATSEARPLSEMGYPMSGIASITAVGLEKKTSLPREAIEAAVERLQRTGLLDVISDNKKRGYDSWRANTTALAAASR